MLLRSLFVRDVGSVYSDFQNDQFCFITLAKEAKIFQLRLVLQSSFNVLVPCVVLSLTFAKISVVISYFTHTDFYLINSIKVTLIKVFTQVLLPLQ